MLLIDIYSERIITAQLYFFRYALMGLKRMRKEIILQTVVPKRCRVQQFEYLYFNKTNLDRNVKKNNIKN